MEKTTKIIIAMLAVIILIIIIIIILLNLNKTNIENKQKEEDNPETSVFTDVEEITNKDLFFQIEKNIKTYFGYLEGNNISAIKAISSQNPVALINKSSSDFKAISIYALDKISYITAYVQGITRNEGTENTYYMIINIDYINATYEIINSSKEEFENAKNNIILSRYREDIVISNNQYNTYNQKAITDFEILQYYFEDYKYKAIYQPKEAFSLLDSKYRQGKFDDHIERYIKYINDNMDRLKDANIVRHSIIKNGQYGTYAIYDIYNNYYKIIETGINKYTIILDNYTVEDEEILKAYNNLSAKEKVHTNIDKIIKLINEKGYTQVYQYLNTNFRQTYFKTEQDFEKYIKGKFFDNNIVGAIQLKEEGEVYVVRVPYKESLSTAAEEREITINMRLGEGTNFEISFNVN